MTEIELPTQPSRLYAVGVHVASLWLPYIAPILGMILGRQDPFVYAHSKHSLKRELLEFAVAAVLITANFLYGMKGLWEHGASFDPESLVASLIRGLVVWIIIGLFGLVNTLFGVLDAYHAYRGRLP